MEVGAMSEGVNHVWVGLGGGPPKICVGGIDAATFKANLAELFGTDMIDVLVAYFDGEATSAAGKAAVRVAGDAAIAAGQAPGEGAPASGTARDEPSHQARVAPGPGGGSGPVEEEDKFGKWTYNIPGAPTCPHGGRVRRAGVSRAGNNYVGWACVTHSPWARRNNKVKDAGCTMDWD